MASNSSLKRGTMPAEEQLLLKEMHMKNSISITPSKQNNRYGDKKYVEPVRLTPAWEEKNLPNDVLNFKSVTMEQAELETNPPKDRFLMVYFIIMTFGIGTLMPWNMFINAKSYFEDYKLSPNYTHTDMKFYKTNFIIFLGIASQVPNFLFNWLNIFVNIGGSLTTRIVYSILIEGVIFVCTEALVLADSSSWFDLFFWLTLGSVFILNTANGIYQNSVYGIAARLPSAYMGAVILGSNLSGVFTALINILMKVLSPSDQTRAVYYFIVALLVLLICFDFYFILPQTKFYKFHDLQFIKAQSNTDDYSVLKRTPYWKIFKMCSLQCFNVFFIFFVTLAIYPAVHANVERSGNSDFFVPHNYFSDITCFVNFNVVAAIGNLLATVWHFPSRKWLHIPILLRAAFIPLFLICNYQIPDRIMPVVIFNEWIYWGIAVLFALTSGWFSSLAMMYCGRSVPAEYSSVAGMFGAACLVTGVCTGILISFVFPVIVKKVQW